MSQNVPAAPVNVGLAPLGSDGVRVTWSPGTGGATPDGYTVVYSTTAPVTKLDHPTAVSGTSCDLTGLVLGMTYYLAVFARAGAAESALSETRVMEIGDTTSPAVPLGLAAGPGPSPGSVAVVWIANTDPDMDHYELAYGSTPTLGMTLSVAHPAVGTMVSWTMSDLAAGTWYFAVRAVDTAGNVSAYCATVSVPVADGTGEGLGSGRPEVEVRPNLVVMGDPVQVVFRLPAEGISGCAVDVYSMEKAVARYDALREADVAKAGAEAASLLVSTRGFAPGVYLVRAVLGDTAYVKKLVVTGP
jgi:hypothetical protein